MTKLRVEGGCLCGQVRYEAVLSSPDAHYCHCRMCQKAAGSIFEIFVGAPKATVQWKTEPRYYASSDKAVRGFCPRCGTPLTFAYHESPELGLTVGSLDHPEQTRPTKHCGIESRVPTFVWQDDLPKTETRDDDRY